MVLGGPGRPAQELLRSLKAADRKAEPPVTARVAIVVSSTSRASRLALAHLLTRCDLGPQSAAALRELAATPCAGARNRASIRDTLNRESRVDAYARLVSICERRDATSTHAAVLKLLATNPPDTQREQAEFLACTDLVFRRGSPLERSRLDVAACRSLARAFASERAGSTADYKAVLRSAPAPARDLAKALVSVLHARAKVVSQTTDAARLHTVSRAERRARSVHWARAAALARCLRRAMLWPHLSERAFSWRQRAMRTAALHQLDRPMWRLLQQELVARFLRGSLTKSHGRLCCRLVATSR